VVFESMFGNTEQVARAVAEGLRSEGVSTQVVDVSAAPTELPPSVDLLVVGAPTHAFSLSRLTTRIEAVSRGADPAKTAVGLREWLERARPRTDQPLHVAVYDTRVSKVRRLPAAAGPSAARLARRRRFASVERPVAFLVADIKGPLIEGELARAGSWGRSLVALTRPAARRPVGVAAGTDPGTDPGVVGVRIPTSD
ncbi:MAG: flavodoxin family protein, partial [Nocardioides sp.]